LDREVRRIPLTASSGEPTTIAAMPYVDGERLRRVREERLPSHRELASLAGVSPTTVLTLKRREVDVQRSTDHKLAVLEVQPAELVK
jgi:predicted transcriptional regulator